jgi:hypothetical protein
MKVKKIIHLNLEILFICNKNIYVYQNHKYTKFQIETFPQAHLTAYKIQNNILYINLHKKPIWKKHQMNPLEKIPKKEYVNYLKYIL